jgi:hypothetical protein
LSPMIERRFSTAELSAHSGLSIPTVKLFVREGVLSPSIQEADGRGTARVFSFQDVLAARALHLLRFPNASAEPLRRLVAFLRSREGLIMLKSFKGGLEPYILLVTATGVSHGRTLDQVMREGETVVFCVDAHRLSREVTVGTVEGIFKDEFREPGPSGRSPRKVKEPKPPKPRRKPAHDRAGKRER